jgi:hypothetical protein
MSNFEWIELTVTLVVSGAFLLWIGVFKVKKKGIVSPPEESPHLTPPNALEPPIWFNLEKHMGEAWMKAALVDCAANQDTWNAKCTEEWFLAIHRYELTFLINYLLNRHLSKEEVSLETTEKIAQLITISSALFDFSVPSALWRMDADIVEMIIAYMVLTNAVDVDISNYPLSPDVVSRRFMLLVNKLTDSDWMIQALASSKRPVNFVFLKSNLLPQLKSDWPFLLGEGDTSFKKALTAVYLIAGVAVPRDYLYVDQEVKDYVLKKGRYAPFKRLKLKALH